MYLCIIATSLKTQALPYTQHPTLLGKIILFNYPPKSPLLTHQRKAFKANTIYIVIPIEAAHETETKTRCA